MLAKSQTRKPWVTAACAAMLVAQRHVALRAMREFDRRRDDDPAARARRRRRARRTRRRRCSRAAASGACRACSSTCSGVTQRRVGLCRRRGEDRALRDRRATATRDTPSRCRSRYDPAQITYGTLAAGLLLGRARSDRAELPGPGSRHAVPLGDLPGECGAADDREGVYRAARCSACVSREDRHDASRTSRAFYPAETYHQDFLTLHPDSRYIAINDLPKIDYLKQMFPDLYRDKAVLVAGMSK